MHTLSRAIDLLDWNSLINDTTKISNLLMVPNLKVSDSNGIVKGCQFIMLQLIYQIILLKNIELENLIFSNASLVHNK